METKELLEIMLDNVNQGLEAKHGLIAIKGDVTDLLNAENITVKAHEYVNQESFLWYVNDKTSITVKLNRLNQLIADLISKKVTDTFPIPNGFFTDDSKIPSYQEMRGLGYSEHILKMYGWLEEYALPPSPAVPPQFKPFIAWVCGGCNHVWPKPDYLFTESQFVNVKPSEFRVKLVNYLNSRCCECKPFAGLVASHFVSDGSVSVIEMEEIVNKRLNEIYQNL